MAVDGPFCFFAKELASHLFDDRFRVDFPRPLIRRAEKCHPARSPQSPRALIAIYAHSRSEHENNEPALGVAELVDRRGWKGINEEGGDDGRRIVRESSGETSRKEPASAFSQRTSRRPVGVDPCTLDIPRVNGEGLVDVETRWRLYSHVTAAAGGTAASSKFTSNGQNFVRG